MTFLIKFSLAYNLPPLSLCMCVCVGYNSVFLSVIAAATEHVQGAALSMSQSFTEKGVLTG